MKRLALLTGFSLGLLVHGSRPAPARACTMSPPELRVADVPANGVVVISISCAVFHGFSSCVIHDVPDVLPVVDAVTREAIPGEVLRVVDSGRRVHVLWLPQEPLVAGRSYELTWRPQVLAGVTAGPSDFVFDALPEVDHDVTAPVFTSALTLDYDDSLHALECETVDKDSCGGNTRSISTSYRMRPALRVSIDTLDVNITHPFELRAALWSSDETPPALAPALWPADSVAYRTFDAVAEQYCYRVELRSLIDDSTALHEDCLPHGDLGAVETVEATNEELAASLQNCIAPPVGYEVEWCMGTRQRCAAAPMEHGGWMAERCDEIERRCAELEGCSAGGRAGHAPSDLLALALAVLAIRAGRRRPG